jgi:hypothetical protein
LRPTFLLFSANIAPGRHELRVLGLPIFGTCIASIHVVINQWGSFQVASYVKPANADPKMWEKTIAFMEKQSARRAKSNAAAELKANKANAKELILRERVQFNDYIKSEGSRRRQALINDEVFVPNTPPKPLSQEGAAEQALLLAKRAQDFLKYEKWHSAAQKHYQKVIAARPELGPKTT